MVIYKGAETIYIFELARVEFIAGVYRKFREREINRAALHAVIPKFTDDLRNRYQVVNFSSLVLDKAQSPIQQLGEKHSLRALGTM